MKIKEIPVYPENESYDNFCVFIICLLNGKCVETSLIRNKDDTNTMASKEDINVAKMSKYYDSFIKSKFGKNNKKIIDSILTENCLESFYKAQLLENHKINNWRYNSGFLEEAYWLYIRILDSLIEGGGAIKFAENIVKTIGFDGCLEIYNRILKDNNESKYRGYLGGTVINRNGNIYLRNFDKKDLKNIKNALISLKKEEKLIFSIFYIIYNIRNKYAHTNFPIPSKLFRSNGLILPATIDEALGVWKKEGNQTKFIYFLDYIKAYNKRKKNKIFINKRSFRLLPSIEFLKEITKIILIKKLKLSFFNLI